MAGFAGRGEARGAVIQGFRVEILLLVAARALRAESNVDPGPGSAMAGVANHRRMPADQREAVAVVRHGLNGDSPSAHAMAVLALRAELASVEIRVAVGALLPRFGKYFRDMARITGHTLVHAPQGELSLLVVIELGLSAKRRPTRGRVAVLARNVQRAMRAPDGLCLPKLRAHRQR